MPIARLGDCALHYVEAGQGPALVLLHGLGGCGEDWAPQIAHFSARHRVIVPDLRGFGATPRGRRRPTIPRLAGDVRELLTQLGVERYVLIGHSMGGAVAQQLARDDARIERLVISNSLPSFRPRTARHVWEFVYRFVAMGLLGPRQLSMLISSRLYPLPSQAPLRERGIARGARNSRLSYLLALLALITWSAAEWLPRLRMPVLVLGSEFDYFARQDVARFADYLPQLQMEFIAAAHHALPTEQPEAFNLRVERFLIASSRSDATLPKQGVAA